ncbi:MAG: Rho termination factor N-terminal domain-containing protein [Eubacteriales bacterium]|nr:Rho termination factor N-terminal domain-containing protein [Eubacteriales bacterium]
MQDREELQKMTVAQLRKYSKEQGITLQTNMPKATIIETIIKSQPERKEAASVISQASRPVRQALIISDDSDDVPVMTVKERHPQVVKPPVAPPAVEPKPATPVAPIASPVAKTNKPTFSLKGARAWHNPRPFVPQQPPTNKFVPPGAQTIKTAYGTEEGSARPVPTFSRFGPDASENSSTPNILYSTPVSVPTGFNLPSANETPVMPANKVGFTDFEENTPAPNYFRKTEGNLSIPEMLASGDVEEGAGVLEITPEGHGFLHVNNCLSGSNDIYMSNAQIRRFFLQNGDYVEGKVRPQQGMDRFRAMLYINSVNGVLVDERKIPTDFHQLTAQYPTKKLRLSSRENPEHLLRFIDLFAPIGFGQRALVELPGKYEVNTIVQQLDKSLSDRDDELTPLIVLAGEKPEEVPEIKEKIKSNVFYATFDAPFEQTVCVGEMAAERAKRLAESGKNVVLIIKDISALSRAYLANAAPGMTSYGALQPLKQLLGVARNLKEGGSVTIIGFIRAGNSKITKKILGEIKPLVNCNIVLDTELYEKGFELPFSIEKSFTYRNETLLTGGEKDLLGKLTTLFSNKTEEEALALLNSMFEKTDTNRELTSRFDTWLELMGEEKQ